MAQTNHGTYYLIDDKGWASQEDLVQFDNRMLKVQEMLLQNIITQIIQFCKATQHTNKCWY